MTPPPQEQAQAQARDEGVPSLHQSTGAPASRILGIAAAQPDTVVTNHDLAAYLDTSDEWIVDRVGISERRFAGEDETLVDMAVSAGTRALDDAGVSAGEVDTVIVPNCTMPSPIPNAAAQVAERIGAHGVGAFDLNAACAGFCYGLAVATDLVRCGSAGTVLVIGAEKMTNVVDPNDRSTAIIFADGAGAAVVGPAEQAEIGPVVWGSAGDLAETITMPDDRFLHQEGQAVFRWATTKIAPVATRAVEAAGLSLADVDVLIPHQANLRIVEAIAKRLRANGARADMVVSDDITYSGNTSSASIPLALDHMRVKGQISRGDVVLIIGFGAGLSYAGQVVIAP